MAYKDQVFTYDPSNIIVLVSGYRLSGMNSISIKKDKAAFKVIEGIRGINTRVKVQDESYTITLNLQQTDPVNDFLSELHILDKRSASGTFEFVVFDIGGNTRFFANHAFIESTPDIDLTTDFTDRVWTIKTLSNTGVFLGGNDKSQQSEILNEIERR